MEQKRSSTNEKFKEQKPADYWVYMLECKDKTFYTGIARNPLKRLAQHNAGIGAKYTRSRKPCQLIFLEKSSTRSQAQSREWEIKQLSKTEKRTLIASPMNQLDSIGTTSLDTKNLDLDIDK